MAFRITGCAKKQLKSSRAGQQNQEQIYSIKRKNIITKSKKPLFSVLCSRSSLKQYYIYFVKRQETIQQGICGSDHEALVFPSEGLLLIIRHVGKD